MKSLNTTTIEDTIHLNHPKFNAEFTFGNDFDKIAIVSKNRQIDNIHFYGFRGFINSPLLEEIQNRAHNQQVQFFSDFLRSIKFSLLKKIISLAHNSPGLLNKYRNIFLRIANDDDCGSEADRIELIKEIPVMLLGVGWKKINELSNKNLYIDAPSNNLLNPKAERAASLGYNVIRASTQMEKALIEKMIGAQSLDKLPEAL
jgi:hypothetical protein